MPIRDTDELKILGGALLSLGLALGIAAAATGLLAADHMAAAAEFCGPTADHCNLCVAAGALVVAALAAGWKAGGPNGHKIENRSGAEAVLLEVGTRTPGGDSGDYPDIDMVFRGDGYFHRDGTSYPKVDRRT